MSLYPIFQWKSGLWNSSLGFGVVWCFLIYLFPAEGRTQCLSKPFPDQWSVHALESSELPYRSVYIYADFDLDGDGLKDIVTGQWWYRNPGSASGNWVRSTIGGSFRNVAHVHDFDGDGYLDLLGTTGAYTGSDMVWAQNNGSGNFTIHSNIPSGDTDFGEPFLAGIAGAHFQTGGPYQMAINWNGAESTNSPVQMLTVPSDPVNTTWPLVDISSSSLGEDMQKGDIDGDGDLDLFQSKNWLRKNDDGTWTTINTGIDYVTTPDRAQLSDFDGDGDLDAVVGQLTIGTTNSARMEFAWFEAPSDPEQNWIRHTLASDINGSLSVFAEDIDLDGDDDIVVGEWKGNYRLIAFENDLCDSGTWIRHTINPGGTGFDHHDGARVVDIDDDGDFDIVSIGWDAIVPRIFENTTSTISNDPPAVNAGSDKDITLPNDSVILNGSGSDPDGGSVSVQWTQISGPDTAALSGEGTNDLTASELVEGSYVFRLTVTDDEDETAFDEVAITVNPEEPITEDPIVDAGADKSINLPENSVILNGSGSDPDGGSVSVQWTQISGPDTAALSGDDTNDLTASELVEGSYVFRLTVTDDEDETAFDEVAITVNPEEPITEDPIVDAGADKSINLPENSVILNGSGSDPDGGSVSVQWTQISGPDTAALSGDDTNDLTASELVEGSYVFRLTVTDDEDETAFDEVAITVNPEEIITEDPIVDAGTDKSITLPENSVGLNGSGSDPDGGSVSVQWTQISGPDTAAHSGDDTNDLTASELVEGSYVFRLTVTDDEDETAFDEVAITVNPEEIITEDPIVDAGADQSITLPENSVGLNGSGSDPDGGEIAFQWTQISGPDTAALSGDDTNGLTASELVEGSYVFRLTVTDDEDATAFDEVSVNVNPEVIVTVNQAPVANATATPLNGEAPLEVTFSASASTDDSGITGYSWSFGNEAESLEANPVYTFETPGAYKVILTVEDTEGLTDSAEITISIAPNITESTGMRLETNPAKNGTAKLLLINPSEDVKIISLYLHDSSGRLIETYNLEEISAGTGTYHLPVATLGDGVYHLGIKTNKGEEKSISLLVRN